MFNLRANSARKSTVSVKMFIKEFGEDFPKHVKERLMDLESRCFLTRKEIDYRFDLKHVEHLQYETASDTENPSAPNSKEYAYGQFAVVDGKLYFSESCIETDQIMQSPMVSSIYNALDSEGIISDEGRDLKRINDNNIDFIVDSILSSCPQVSQSYMDIVKGMVSRSNNK